jgi:tetratricopeptide (TPR) repeat protein/predicted aspartyl protease
MLRSWLTGFVLLGLADSGSALAVCQLQKFPDLPVTMNGLRPMVHAKVNGSDALFIADSGAFYSSLTPAMAASLHLSLRATPFGFMVLGVGGASQAWVTEVAHFMLMGVDIPKIEFLVTGNDLDSDAVGLLGQNVFRIGDVEYDLANGVIRLWRPKDCGHSALAYWAKASSQTYSVIDIEYATRLQPHTAGVVSVNNVKMRVVFDTGAAGSAITLAAAKRAGVSVDAPGVVAAGQSFGIGRQAVQTWIAPFASFKIGDEEIRNTKLRIDASLTQNVDMLIGADFFLSHRIFVATSQRKLYFTYNGGPVFNLTAGTSAAKTNSSATDTAGAAPAAAPPDTAPAAAPAPGQPTDAAAFARRGAAFVARHDYEHGLADLTRACELDPSEASYFYQRGMAHWYNRQPELAQADLDQAIKLKPDEVDALVARADLRLGSQDTAAAATDLAAASRAAPRQSQVHIHLGDDYARLAQFAAAAAEFGIWIDSHDGSDVYMPRVRGARCRARALWGQELDAALADCNAALKSSENRLGMLSSRGLIQQRRGDYDKAIADYTQAISLQPKDAWALYLRGVAKLRQGKTGEGQSDIAAATALDAKVAARASQRGITP